MLQNVANSGELWGQVGFNNPNPGSHDQQEACALICDWLQCFADDKAEDARRMLRSVQLLGLLQHCREAGMLCLRIAKEAYHSINL